MPLSQTKRGCRLHTTAESQRNKGSGSRLPGEETAESLLGQFEDFEIGLSSESKTLFLQTVYPKSRALLKTLGIELGAHKIETRFGLKLCAERCSWQKIL